MKTTVFAATLALLAGTPLVASAAGSMTGVESAVAAPCYETAQQPGGCVRTAWQPLRPRFIGPYEVRHGLLPNGLTPNAFTYG